jgi:nitroreductase
MHRATFGTDLSQAYSRSTVLEARNVAFRSSWGLTVALPDRYRQDCGIRLNKGIAKMPTRSSQLLRARYRQTMDSPAQWNEVLTTLLSHRSVRSYLPTPLPPGTLETIIAAAQSAPTSSNLQAWSVIAVEDADRKARLSELAGGQKHIREAPLFLVWLADLARLKDIAQRQGIDSAALGNLEYFILSVVDTALAAQNALTALESLGMGGVFIGAIRNHPEDVAAELTLPPHVLPVFGLCVGYADQAVPTDVKPRLPQQAVLHHEHYATADATAAIAAYDVAMRSFQQEQGMDLIDWSRQAAKRIDRLGTRVRMAEAVRNLGFPLR